MANSNKNTNPAGLSQAYIDELRASLDIASNCYNENSAAANKADKELIQAKNWEACIKDYLNKAGKSCDLITDLETYIGSVKIHVKKVCVNIGYAKKSTIILAEASVCLSKKNEELKGLVRELLDIIDCLNDPILKADVSIMKCLLDFKAKVDEGVKANLALIRSLLDLIKKLVKLELSICPPTLLGDDLDLDKKLKSLQDLSDDLNRLTAILKGENCKELSLPGREKPWCIEDPVDIDLDECKCTSDCGEEITGTLALPSSCGPELMQSDLIPDCSTYLNRMRAEYNDAEKTTCYRRCVWKYYRDLALKAKTDRDAIQAALDAALAAKRRCN